jgi:hypothetical protein
MQHGSTGTTPVGFSIAQLQNYLIPQFSKEFHAEERPLDTQNGPRARHDQSFSEKQVREGVISCGLSSYGYDLRLGRRVQNFHQRQLDHR